MLNVFPSLLTYSFFAPMLLRALVALSIAYIVWVQYKRREEISHMRAPLIGVVGGLLWLGLAAELAVAAALFVGYYTQIAALFGLALSLKHYIFAKKYPSVIPFSRATYVFIFIICFTLLLTGAGALAFDLPL